MCPKWFLHVSSGCIEMPLCAFSQKSKRLAVLTYAALRSPRLIIEKWRKCIKAFIDELPMMIGARAHAWVLLLNQFQEDDGRGDGAQDLKQMQID